MNWSAGSPAIVQTLKLSLIWVIAQGEDVSVGFEESPIPCVTEETIWLSVEKKLLIRRQLEKQNLTKKLINQKLVSLLAVKRKRQLTRKKLTKEKLTVQLVKELLLQTQ